jgi:L-malate glycosyltransferase
MKKIRILIIIPEARQGGAETQLQYLLKLINKNKFKIYLGFLYNDDQIKKEFETIGGIELINFNKVNKYDLKIYFKIANFIKKFKIDIIQTFMGNNHSYIPSIIAKKSIAVGGIRASFNKKNSVKDRILEFLIPKLLCKLGKLYLVSNNYQGKNIYLKEGFLPTVLKVIPNGIDYDTYSFGNKLKVINEFNLKNKVVIGMVGRLFPGKNQENLIKVFNEMIKIHKNLFLMIIGDGIEMDNLCKLTNDLNLSNKVIFTGNRKDIPNILSALDIFLFPSLFPEGWPNAIGEAMAAGLPVVSFDIGDVKYIIKDGIDGYIVEKNINKLKEITLKLIKNKNLRVSIGKDAQKKIRSNFSVIKMVNSYEKLYTDLIKNENINSK